MRVCYFGTYDFHYSRNRIMIEGLTRNGIEVVECHVPLWQGTADKVSTAQHPLRRPDLLVRIVQAYGTLLYKIRQMGPCDALIVGYMGQLDAFLARRIANHLQIPFVLDVFMSISLISRERQITRPGAPLDRLIGWVEKQACRMADMLWLDTPLYVAYFEERYGLSPSRFRLIPTGADDRYYFPVPPPPKPTNQWKVSYVGKYIPLHGVPTIIEAAALLRDENITFEMIGEGEAKPAMMALARERNAHNILFEGWVDKSRLSYRLAGCDVCLGIFGRQRQGLITIPNKIYEGLAMRKPVITGRTPAAERAFESGHHLLLVPLQDPQALAQAIRQLRDDPALRSRLAQAGYELYKKNYTPTALGALAAGYLNELLQPTIQPTIMTL